jgi:RNase P subunit RPR2
MERRFNNKDKKTFSISLQEETVKRIRYVREVAKNQGHDAYKDLDYTIFKWLLEQEKKYDIKKNEHRTTMFCPKCKNKLRIVHSKNGDFIGCSSFPECNYTKNLKE